MKHLKLMLYFTSWAIYLPLTYLICPYLRLTTLLLSIPFTMSSAWLFKYKGALTTFALSTAYHMLLFNHYAFESPTATDALNPIGLGTQLFFSAWTAMLKVNSDRYQELNNTLELTVEQQTAELRFFTEKLIDLADIQQSRTRALLNMPLQEMKRMRKNCVQLEQKLQKNNSAELESAQKVSSLVNDCIIHLQKIDQHPAEVLSRTGNLQHALIRLSNQLQDLAETTITVHDSPRWAGIPRSATLDLYHIVHEALTNAVRHALPSRIEIGISQSSGGYTIYVTNDGKEFMPTHTSGMGIALMKHRASRIGATLTIESAPQKRTTAACFIPVS